MLQIYKTILHRGRTEIIEKKSRFIATSAPASCEEIARNFIEEMKKEFWDATHNVYAYQIGERNEIIKSSDDGEPQGTAGKPVLEALSAGDIKNAVIVVTRYFGGTLLGTGGLVRAYGRAAKEGLLAAEPVEIKLYQQYSVVVAYTLSGKIQYEMLQNEFYISDTLYTDMVEYQLLIEISRIEEFEKKVIEATSAQASIIKKDAVYGAQGKEGIKIL